MSKQLLIVRHAKSDWENPELPDFKRPLNSRGNKNAPEMARRLVTRNIIPQELVSSPALRAISTAEYFAKELGIRKADIVLEAGIYEALPNALLNIVNNLNNGSNFTALFGHNPGLTTLVKDLCNNDLYNIPTCGMALIKFPVDDWKMVGKGSGELVFFDYPKKDN